jgi:nucleoid-associated protein YgaU
MARESDVDINAETQSEAIADHRRGERGQAERGPAEKKTYIVKAGDTLSEIAQSEMGDADRWQELYAANKDAVGDNPHMIHPGLKLEIPA